MEIRRYEDEMREKDLAVVYQMGKVASTSLVNTINELGYIARQPHFLGEVAFTQILKNILNRDMSDYFYYHNRGQLIENIDTMRMIELSKKYGKKVKMITLARRPENWYWSAVMQDYEGVLPQFKKHCKDNSKHFDDDYEIIEFFYTGLIEFIKEQGIVIGDYNSSAGQIFSIKNQLNDKKYDLFISHLLMLNRPLIWFDQFIKDVFDIDIFEFPLTDNSVVINKNGIELLVLDFENIKNSHSAIESFLGTKSFELKRDNLSSEKNNFDVMKKIKEDFNESLSEALSFKSTKYSKYFGY